MICDTSTLVYNILIKMYIFNFIHKIKIKLVTRFKYLASKACIFTIIILQSLSLMNALWHMYRAMHVFIHYDYVFQSCKIQIVDL